MAVFKEAVAGGVRQPVFWLEPTKRDVMGYKLTVTGLAAGTPIPQGTALKVDDKTKTAVICKFVYIVLKNSTTEFAIKKNSFLSVGEKIWKSGQETATLSTVSSIDYSHPEYDIIKLAAANSQLVKGDVAVVGETANVVPNLPNRVVAREQLVEPAGLPTTVSATFQAVLIDNIVHYPVEFTNVVAFPGTKLLVGCPGILFIIQ